MVTGSLNPQNGGNAVIPVIVALAEALFYLLCVPVNLALVLEDGAGLKVGAGVSAFAGWRARRRALSDLSGENGHKKSGPEPGRVWAVLRRVRFERLEIYGSVGLGDAAATALLCGALNGMACGLRGRAGRFRADVRPDFSNDFRVALSGMLTARTGQIIRAIILMRGSLQHGKASH